MKLIGLGLEVQARVEFELGCVEPLRVVIWCLRQGKASPVAKPDSTSVDNPSCESRRRGRSGRVEVNSSSLSFQIKTS